MSATLAGEPRRVKGSKALRGRVLLAPVGAPRASTLKGGLDVAPREESSFIDLGDSARVALMLTPKGRGGFGEQTREVFAAARSVLERQTQPMTMTAQTIFLRDRSDRRECEAILAACFDGQPPVTNFVFQAPCSGAALVLEAWAIGGRSVRVEHYGPNTLAVSYDSVRWVYCAGIEPASGRVYGQSIAALERMRGELERAGSGFEHVVRTWFYLGGITQTDDGTQRYGELDRSRGDFYRDIQFCASLRCHDGPGQDTHAVYPASTGIGMCRAGLVASCMTLQTNRKDAFVVPLENP